MSKVMTETPIFLDALAAAAGCNPADAEEHFLELAKAEAGDTYLIQTFIEQYGTPAAKDPAPDTAG